jgi:hypothetical protein
MIMADDVAQTVVRHGSRRRSRSPESRWQRSWESGRFNIRIMTLRIPSRSTFFSAIVGQYVVPDATGDVKKQANWVAMAHLGRRAPSPSLAVFLSWLSNRH